MIALAVDDVTKSFGGVRALTGVTLSLNAGERLVLLGPNGAGKTTLFHTISGNIIASSGRIRLFGDDITQLPPDARARLGLARTFQITNLFAQLTVLENILLAVCGAEKLTFKFVRPLSGYDDIQKRARALLEEWNLAEAGDQLVRNLSYGEQRQVEVVMALSGAPRILLLDEPTAGLSPAETLRVVEMVRMLPRDMTIVMIEHDMDVAFEVADRIAVMHQGRVIAEGDEAAIRGNQQVSDIYLGVE
ncbi:MAG: Amino acid/amide transporter ATP-binding protein 1, family [Hyphomicrobiales bacterium]|jgi:branched-chain amino acid transport system ATP-binding protein|nr:Amino acid/amide transporter ATP-binding protein 1, family [Hyphomicrobiales bacterium]